EPQAIPDRGHYLFLVVLGAVALAAITFFAGPPETPAVAGHFGQARSSLWSACGGTSAPQEPHGGDWVLLRPTLPCPLPLAATSSGRRSEETCERGRRLDPAGGGP